MKAVRNTSLLKEKLLDNTNLYYDIYSNSHPLSGGTRQYPHNWYFLFANVTLYLSQQIVIFAYFNRPIFQTSNFDAW